MFTRQAICTILFAAFAAGHSWLDCTDYRMTSGAQSDYYDPAVCQGYARGGQQQKDAGFGQDTGFNNKAQTCQAGNDTPQRAQYTPGQRVCLAYPAKNHVADATTNQYIPDLGVKIMRTQMGDASDTFTTEYQHLNGVHQDGQIDYKGFQNCPKFAENNDKALCTMCFDLEADLAAGAYAFMWQWELNAGEFYTTCWDADVAGAYDPTNAAQAPAESPTVTPAAVPAPVEANTGNAYTTAPTQAPVENTGNAYTPAPPAVAAVAPSTGNAYTPAPTTAAAATPSTGNAYTPAPTTAAAATPSTGNAYTPAPTTAAAAAPSTGNAYTPAPTTAAAAAPSTGNAYTQAPTIPPTSIVAPVAQAATPAVTPCPSLPLAPTPAPPAAYC